MRHSWSGLDTIPVTLIPIRLPFVLLIYRIILSGWAEQYHAYRGLHEYNIMFDT
jgi:hypothetical protein